MSICATACLTCWPPPRTCCTPPASRTARPMAKAAPISKRCASGTGRRSIARPSAISRINWWGGERNIRIQPSFRDAPLGAGPESILPVVVMDSGLALRAPRNDKELFPRLGHLLDPARQHRPIGAGPQALQQVHEARVVTNQYARLVVLDALNDAQRGGGGRGFCDGIETLDRLRAARIVGDAGAGAGVAHDIGGNAARMHHR